MARSKKKADLPQNMNISEASEFFDEHSLFEFKDTEDVDVKFKLKRRKYVGIDSDMFKRLKSLALQMKVSPEALLESWIDEKTSSMKNTGAG